MEGTTATWPEKHRSTSIPPYCPHLDPIERLWALMHENVTHNRDYKTFAEFRREIIKFLRHTVPKRWKRFRDRITDNFRVIHRTDFRILELVPVVCTGFREG